ncbi:hypothetical protein B0T21DRAFT_367778 [Apiosordaria backusii]|uniref:SAP domain-containing protein n=1 Tax=Apiosordaria backusii TaxID=314023 RepID=A0AA40BJL7_9PEZI|nr:hypothetical protein B0T21DRAFT_367778 [Apiosordaria backusii]
MVDYNSMKVPELKKVLQERGLPLTGNKADLIARLQENDKQKAPETAEPKADTKPAAAEDEIDYDDDDFPPIKNGSADEAKKADAPATQDKPEEKKTEDVPATETKADEPAPAATAEEGDKPVETTEEPAAPAAPLFTQNLAATNAQTEAEKRAARAARFGIVLDEDSEEAKAAARAAKFGVANDQISALDSALPERGPRKRGRDAKDDDSKPKTADGERANKRQQQQPPNNARNANNNRNQQQRGGRRGGPGGGRNNNQQQRNGNVQKASGGAGGSGKPQPQRVEDPAEKAKREARAKRFA